MVDIQHLGDNREYVDTVTNWIWSEFGNEDNYNFFESIVKSSLTKGKLPTTFIAFLDGEAVGTVGLWRSDLMSRQDLYPWLSALFVREDKRGKGIGRKLQQFLVQYCKEKGYRELFLYTDINNYYEKDGWIYIEDGVEYSGDYIKIYKKRFID